MKAKSCRRYCATCKKVRYHRTRQAEEIWLQRCSICRVETQTKGIVCPKCGGTRFRQFGLSRPCPGLVLRYRMCVSPGCDGTIRTSEKCSPKQPRRYGDSPARPSAGAQAGRRPMERKRCGHHDLRFVQGEGGSKTMGPLPHRTVASRANFDRFLTAFKSENAS